MLGAGPINRHTAETAKLPLKDPFVRILLWGKKTGKLNKDSFLIFPSDIQEGPATPHEQLDWAQKLGEAALRDLAAALMAAERRRLRDVQRRFMAHMDQEALLLMRQTRTLEPRIYNWLNADGDKVKCRNRHQAVKSYPILTMNFVLSEELTQTIDKGEELRSKLQEALGDKEYGPIKKSTLQRLSTLPRALYISQLPKKVVYLDALPPERWPKQKPEWEALNTVIKYAEEYANFTGQKATNVLAGIKDEWGPLAARLKKTGEARDARDFVARLKNIVIGPALAEATEKKGKEVSLSWLNLYQGFIDDNAQERSLSALMLRGLSFTKIFHASKEWHDRLRTFDARIESIDLCAKTDRNPSDENEWIPLTKAVTAPNGLTIRPLSSAAMLRETGKEMNHCVGGYASLCMLHKHHVLDITDADGKRLSTVELAETDNPEKPLRISQNKSVGNLAPPPEASQAAQWYVAQIESGALQPDWAAIQKKRHENHEYFSKDNLARQIGFDPYNTTSADAAFEVCRPFLPSASQGISRRDWLEKTGIAAAVKKLVAGEGVSLENNTLERLVENINNFHHRMMRL